MACLREIYPKRWLLTKILTRCLYHYHRCDTNDPGLENRSLLIKYPDFFNLKFHYAVRVKFAACQVRTNFFAHIVKLRNDHAIGKLCHRLARRQNRTKGVSVRI